MLTAPGRDNCQNIFTLSKGVDELLFIAYNKEKRVGLSIALDRDLVSLEMLHFIKALEELLKVYRVKKKRK